MALLDANTGVNLLGDSGLNLQADGTEHRAAQVTKVVNNDGSITYRVDLSSLSNALKAAGSAGQAVNLSFDLIGFAHTTSHINVSDVRVSGLPELHDVAASVNEDTTLAFDPFAQVDNAALLQLGSHVVDQPAHGAVTVNRDGTFAYVPAANYFGTDSFTYRLNDGPLESNLATVTVSIAAVNDAPVANDVAVHALEDSPQVIDLRGR